MMIQYILQWLGQKMFFGSKFVYSRPGKGSDSEEEVKVREDDDAVLSCSDDDNDDGEVSEEADKNDKIDDVMIRWWLWFCSLNIIIVIFWMNIFI